MIAPPIAPAPAPITAPLVALFQPFFFTGWGIAGLTSFPVLVPPDPCCAVVLPVLSVPGSVGVTEGVTGAGTWFTGAADVFAAVCAGCLIM